MKRATLETPLERSRVTMKIAAMVLSYDLTRFKNKPFAQKAPFLAYWQTRVRNVWGILRGPNHG